MSYLRIEFNGDVWEWGTPPRPIRKEMADAPIPPDAGVADSLPPVEPEPEPAPEEEKDAAFISFIDEHGNLLNDVIVAYDIDHEVTEGFLHVYPHDDSPDEYRYRVEDVKRFYIRAAQAGDVTRISEF